MSQTYNIKRINQLDVRVQLPKLNRNGFRWAYNSACWQRQLNFNSIRAAKEVLKNWKEIL